MIDSAIRSTTGDACAPAETPSRTTHVLRDEFAAMGSTVEVVVVLDGDTPLADDLLGLTRRMVAELEQRWSRFLPDSDITRLNLADGAPIEVHPHTIALLEAMARGVRATDGAFDPTMLAAIVACGYAVSRVDPQHTTVLPQSARLRTSFDDVVIDGATTTVVAPVGACFDPGGIGKGVAADLVAAALLAHGAAGALVGVGGDVRVVGVAPQDGGWAVAVRHPLDTTVETALLRLMDGAVATSGTARRRWAVSDGSMRHHLLDPATAAPVTATADEACAADVDEQSPRDLVEATVVAGTAAWAEVWSTALFVIGATDGLSRLDDLGLPARATFADGRTVANRAWSSFAAPPASCAASDAPARAAASSTTTGPTERSAR